MWPEPNIDKLIQRLDGATANQLESETVEFKSWEPGGQAYKRQLGRVRETTVAFANAKGGLLVLGVADGKRSRAEAIKGVGRLDANRLRREIYDGTEPHILVEVIERNESEGRILVIRVPPGIPPHTTAEGVAKIRVDKHNKPLTGANLARLVVARGGRDLTAEVLPGVGLSDFGVDQMRLLRRTIEADTEQRALAALGDRALLEALGLARGDDVTVAGVLLIGSRLALARLVPGHELTFLSWRENTRYDLRRDMRSCFLEVLEQVQDLLTANLRMTTVEPRGFTQLEIPDITWWVAREAVLNALVHRDYFVSQSIHLNLHQDRVEIISPGGFIGGVSDRNILRHPPVRRNPLLADVLQTIGLVNRVGVGVDRIYEELLSMGKNSPRYESDESHVKLVLPTATNHRFARFVFDVRRDGQILDLDDLIMLNGLVRRKSLDRWSAADLLQSSNEQAADRLVSLRRRGFLVARGRGRGTSYSLSRRYVDLLVGQDTLGEDSWMDEEYVRFRLLEILSDRGRLANSEIRRITGYSRGQVLKLMQALRQQGMVEVRGRGRGSHYVPVGDINHHQDASSES